MKLKSFLVFLIFILLISSSILLFVGYLNHHPITKEKMIREFNVQDFKYWHKKDIYYSVYNCSQKENNLIVDSFSEIQNAINNKLNFQVRNMTYNFDTDITIQCVVDIDKHLWSETVGTAQVNYYEGDDEILSAEIILKEGNKKSAIEHEIIHALGISGHSTDDKSIMYGWEEDNQKLDNNTIAQLNWMYLG